MHRGLLGHFRQHSNGFWNHCSGARSKVSIDWMEDLEIVKKEIYIDITEPLDMVQKNG